MVVVAKSILAVLGLAAAAVDATVVPQDIHAGFTLAQTPIKAKHQPPAAQYARILRKYNATIPGHVFAAASKQASSIPATSVSDDLQYVIKVTAGASTLNLDLDTGSADLWTFSSETPSNELGGHNVYKPSSSAQKQNSQSWDVDYGDGSSASGDVYTDKVTVGGITSDRQAIEAARHVSETFIVDTTSDGLLGMASSKINTISPHPQKTFFENVKEKLSQPIFTAALKHKSPGSYDFGFIDHSKYSGKLTYTSADSSQGYWGFDVDSFQVGSGISKRQGFGMSAIVDTGTTLLLLNPLVVLEYYSNVEGAQMSPELGGFVFPCDAQLPDVTFSINGYQAVVPGSLINYLPFQGQCFGGIQSNEDVGFSIFGDIFLKSQFVVFDGGSSPRLGFAKQT